MRKKILVFAMLLVVASLVFTGCGGGKDQGGAAGTGEKPVLKVGYLPITHSLPLVVAHRLDAEKYQNLKLELVPFSSWPDLTEALNSGQIQAAITMFEIAMVSKQRGIPSEILLLSHRNGDVLVVNNEIQRIEDLKGRRVAIPHRLSGHNILLYKALKDAGIDYGAVEKVEMAPPEMPAALARGEIAGYIVAEPFGAQSVVGGAGKVLLRAQDIWEGWICCGLVANPSFSQQYPEATQEFINSLVAAGRFIQANPAEAIAIAQDYMKIRGELWEKSLSWISYDDLKPEVEDFKLLQNYLRELPWDGKPGILLGGEVNLKELVNTTYATRAYEQVN